MTFVRARGVIEISDTSLVDRPLSTVASLTTDVDEVISVMVQATSTTTVMNFGALAGEHLFVYNTSDADNITLQYYSKSAAANRSIVIKPGDWICVCDVNHVADTCDLTSAATKTPTARVVAW